MAKINNQFKNFADARDYFLTVNLPKNFHVLWLVELIYWNDTFCYAVGSDKYCLRLSSLPSCKTMIPLEVRSVYSSDSFFSYV